MNLCEQCGQSVYRTKFSTAKKQWLGVDCGCTQMARIAASTVNPFSIVFDHVSDEFGNKLKVENIRQLSAAEKRLGFQSVVLNSDAQNFNDPPQQRKIDISDVHAWKFSSRERHAAGGRR